MFFFFVQEAGVNEKFIELNFFIHFNFLIIEDNAFTNCSLKLHNNFQKSLNYTVQFSSLRKKQVFIENLHYFMKKL